MSQHELKPLTFAEFAKWYKDNKPKRFITEVHLHHNWKPDKHAYALAENKEKVIADVYRRDKDVRGLNDFGQNLLLTPDGMVWVLRDLNEPPSSIKGRNGNDKFGPMSVIILGNFDKGKEVLEGEQEVTLIDTLKLLFDVHNVGDDKFIFHSEHSPRTSPGSSLNKNEILDKVKRTGSSVLDYVEFRDCEGHRYESAINQAVNDGVLGLSTDGSFYPNSLVTRGELAFLYANMVKVVTDSVTRSIDVALKPGENHL